MFKPRTNFVFPSRSPSWYIGHMHKGMRLMTEQLNSIDVVVEARDARIPITGINYEFEKMLNIGWKNRSKLGGIKERIIVYTKRDLAECRYEKPIKSSLKKIMNQRTLFSDNKNDHDPKIIHRELVEIARRNDCMKLNVLVSGMPNVGKSTFLNALRRVGVRKGKAAITGSNPGVTRKVIGTVKINEDPAIYVYDTPGIMVPFLGHDETGVEMALKLALTSGLKPDLIENETILDYLLYKLNLRDNDLHPPYTSQLPLGENYPPTNDIYQLLNDLGKRIGALRKGGVVDMDKSSQFLINAMRNGKFGRWTLDDLALSEDMSLPLEERVHDNIKKVIDKQQNDIINETEKKSKTSILKQDRIEKAKAKKRKQLLIRNNKHV